MTDLSAGQTTRRLSGRRITLVLAAVVLLAVGGGWYYIAGQAGTTPAATTVKTAKVRVGDITITASGTGALVAAREANLGFKSTGRLVELPVQTGDLVAAGQTLAKIDEADAQAQVKQAEINLKTAELKLASISRSAEPAALAAAEDNLTSAQEALAALGRPADAAALTAAQDNLSSAQAALNEQLAGPSALDVAPARADLELAQINLQNAQGAYDKVAWRPDVESTPQAVALWQATAAYEKAKAAYDSKAAPYGEDQIAAARAKVSAAQAQVDALLAGPMPEQVSAARAKVSAAQAQLDALLKGQTSEDLDTAKLAVEQARNNLDTARLQLDNAVLKAPFAGTVISLKANVGEWIGTAPIIGVAVLEPPLVRFYVEESDLDKVAVGMPVAATFNGLPDKAIQGKVVRIGPALVAVDSVPSAEVIAELDTQTGEAGSLRLGMGADVEVTAAAAKGVILAPAEAVREVGPNTYTVFVVKEDGQMELRPVEVGLRDFANVEIVSGVKNGELVSTGTVETK